MSKEKDAPFWCAGGCGHEWRGDEDQDEWRFRLVLPTPGRRGDLTVTCPDCDGATTITA